MTALLRPSLQSMAVKVPLSTPVVKYQPPAVVTPVKVAPVLKVTPAPAARPILELDLTVEPKKILTTVLTGGPSLVVLVGLAVLLLWAAIPLAKGALRRASK